MCLSSDNDTPETIPTPAPPKTLSQEAPEAPERGSGEELDSTSNRAAQGTKKYKTESDLNVGSSLAVKAPSGIKV